MTEQDIQQHIRVDVSRGDVRLWRNNVGTAWTGSSTRITAENVGIERVRLRPGDVVIRSGRVFHGGLSKGSGDLIGLRSLIVQPEHVGRRLAVFASVEVKKPGGRVAPEQKTWAELIRQFGGFAGIARSSEEATAVVYPEGFEG